jgi:GTP-binding protein
LNRILEEAYKVRKPRPKGGKVGKIFYGTQVGVSPPSIVIFVNAPGLFDEAYSHYLANRLREAGPFAEVPIRIRFRPRPRKQKKNTEVTK